MRTTQIFCAVFDLDRGVATRAQTVARPLYRVLGGRKESDRKKAFVVKGDLLVDLDVS